MNEDYLWDRSGPEDPEIARLERSLGMLRAQDPPAPLRPSATSATSAPSTTSATFASSNSMLRDDSDRGHALPGLGRRFVLPFAGAATLALFVLFPSSSTIGKSSLYGTLPEFSTRKIFTVTGSFFVF